MGVAQPLKTPTGMQLAAACSAVAEGSHGESGVAFLQTLLCDPEPGGAAAPAGEAHSLIPSSGAQVLFEFKAGERNSRGGIPMRESVDLVRLMTSYYSNQTSGTFLLLSNLPEEIL